MVSLEEYQEETSQAIESTLEASDVQPVLLVGSGLSIRYFSGPNWDGLLRELSDLCPKVEFEYGYYRQKHNPKEIGEILAEKYAEWAWQAKGDEFDESLFEHSNSPDIFLKSKVSEILSDLTPDSPTELEDEMVSGDLTAEEALGEIEILTNIQPHAIITTNYDTFLENSFNENINGDDADYKVVIGEQVLRNQYQHLGEILKIHGCVTKPDSIVLTDSDYRDFNNRRRYLSSKLLTYLLEHPVLILGYGAGDSNVRQIFSWVKQVLPKDKEIAEDIYYVTYVEDLNSLNRFPREKDIRIEGGTNITVNQIAATEFDWVFDSFAESSGLKLPIGQARNLVGNTYRLVSTQEASGEVVDYSRLENVAEDEEELAKVLGIAVEEVPPIEFDHYLRPSELAVELGLGHFVNLNQLIDELAEETGVGIRTFNNRYHIAFFEEEGVEPRRYSQDAIELLEAFNSGEAVDLDIPEDRIPD